MPEHALELHQIRFSFPEDVVPVLSDVSFRLKQGGKASLIGPSGSGKTLLLKILSGLYEVSSGTVKLFDQDRSTLSKPEKKRIHSELSMTFQRSGLFDSLSVSENLDFPLRELTSLSRSQRLEKIDWILAEVGLLAQKALFPHEISGGMQKRLGIARALILSPKLLLCDDPTAGLDPITSSQILDLILKLVAETQSTLLVSTSDLLVARKLSEQGGELHFLFGGKVQSFPDWKSLWESTLPAPKQFVHGETTGPLTERI